jgi:hypothetical protein
MSTKGKLQATPVQSDPIQNKVHKLIADIESYYRRDGRKKDFTRAALTGVLEILDEIVAMENVSEQRKIDLLARICTVGNQKIEQLSGGVVTAPRTFWSTRNTDPTISPCDFVKTNYPTYGRGLILSDIRKSDAPLYRSLLYYKREHGWPQDFDLKSKREKYDEILAESHGEINLDSLDDLPPMARRNKRRLHSAQQYRKKKAASR